jgi:hypothetical protein
VLVTVAADRTVIDRRRVELVDASLPALPHHHECQGLPLAQALALVRKVERSASACAADALGKLSASVSAEIAAVAIRECPTLPESVAERISSYWAQNRADSVMYRQALARAAQARGWSVHWYPSARVFHDAARVLGASAVEPLLHRTGERLGPPWRKDHRVAMAAALAASARVTRGRHAAGH